MGCHFPLGTYRQDGSPTYRPCGMCIGCKLEYSRQWAVRCTHESSLYKDNCFITLTYDDKNLPEDQSIHKSELQNFIKRLRKHCEPNKIRYYGCGEYGAQLGRPHYHLCLFNHNFNDRKIFRYNGPTSKFNGKYRTGNNHSLYISKDLSKIWRKGFSTIGDMSFESAGYTARYCTKKITGKWQSDHYKEKQPEFALMSRRPGIGTEWLKKYLTDVYPKDYHTLNGVKMRPSRFYDSIMEKIDKEKFEEIKQKRIKNAIKRDEKIANTMRGYHLEKYRKNVTKTLKRGIEWT